VDGGEGVDMRRPFTLYKEQTKSGTYWYVRFWNEEAQKYALSRSTGVPVEGKRERKREAEDIVRAMLPTIRFTTKTVDKPFLQYVADFWSAESAYVKECAIVKKKPLSTYYVRMRHDDVQRHMAAFPGFQKLTLNKLNSGVIRDWMTWAAEKGLSGNRINSVLEGMRVAVRYMVARDELEKDPFKNIGEATEEPKEKGILTPIEVTRLIHSPIQDARSRLAVLLGLLCGMRRGEVRGLQWGDIADGLINVQHNYLNYAGMKIPKCGGIT
jgi:hypothetical protein